MRLGILASIVLHLVALGWALISIHTAQERRVLAPEAVAVDLVSISELTRLKQGARNAKEQETQAKESPVIEAPPKEAPKPTPTAAAPPPPAAVPPPEPVKPEPPKPPEDEIAKKLAAVPPEPVKPVPPPEPVVAPGPNPDEQKLLEQKLADEQRKAEELKQQQEAARQKELERQKKIAKQKELARLKAIADARKAKELEKQKQAAFDPNAICKALGTCEGEQQKAQISKVLPKGGPAAAAKSDLPATAKGPSKGVTEGRDNQLSATERDQLFGIISSRMRDCWHIPAAGGSTKIPVVAVQWRLKLDGSLDGEPQVLQPRSDPGFQLAAEAALRAVRACSPFDQLPPAKYANWKLITWDFDPTQQQ